MITRIYVIMIIHSGQSLGYGFVNFYSERDADRSVRAFNGYRLHNKQIKVCYTLLCYSLSTNKQLYCTVQY